MGLFNFWKKSGKSLDAEAEAAPKPEVLKKEIEALGLDSEGVEIEVEGDKVKLSGKSRFAGSPRESHPGCR